MLNATLDVLDCGDPLFANHLAFLKTHRGHVTIGTDEIRVEGLAPFLSSWTPRNGRAQPPTNGTAARLIPSLSTDWDDPLLALGYKPAEALAYMELGEKPFQSRPAAAEIEIERVATVAGARDFAAVQAAAFLNPEEPQFGWWVRTFVEMATRNFARRDQSFFIARQDGTAVAVLLGVYAADVCGIYAVATCPQFQRRGLSTALLGRVRVEAKERAAKAIILQAVAGSYAHGFYGRLGFAERYRSQVWRQLEA